MRVQSLGQEDPLEKGRQPTAVFLSGESHGQRSLTGYIQTMGSQSQTRLKRLSTHSHLSRGRALLYLAELQV